MNEPRLLSESAEREQSWPSEPRLSADSETRPLLDLAERLEGHAAEIRTYVTAYEQWKAERDLLLRILAEERASE